MAGTDILTIIVNYRTPALVIEALHSLAGEAGQRTIVIDNGSGDDSAHQIR